MKKFQHKSTLNMESIAAVLSWLAKGTKNFAVVVKFWIQRVSPHFLKNLDFFVF